MVVLEDIDELRDAISQLAESPASIDYLSTELSEHDRP
jgi:hypothetical protein